MSPYGNVAIAIKKMLQNFPKKSNVLTSNPEKKFIIQLFATITKW